MLLSPWCRHWSDIQILKKYESLELKRLKKAVDFSFSHQIPIFFFKKHQMGSAHLIVADLRYQKKSTGLIFIPVEEGALPLALVGTNFAHWISALVSFPQRR